MHTFGSEIREIILEMILYCENIDSRLPNTYIISGVRKVLTWLGIPCGLVYSFCCGFCPTAGFQKEKDLLEFRMGLYNSKSFVVC